jgi:hypothetical protein
VTAAKTAGVCLVLAGLVLALFPAGCEKESPVIETWEKTFGGDTTDVGRSVRQTSDGGYIIAGDTRSQGAGRSDAWLIKTDSAGNRLWDKTFGGESPDGGKVAEQTSDGGYIIIGSTQSYGAGGVDAWLIKTDANGNEVWSKTYGGTNHDIAYAGQQTSDGGYVAVGSTRSYAADSTSSEIWLTKTDASGNVTWVRTYGPGDGFSIQQTTDGGFIVAGDIGGVNGDLRLLKIDPDGDLVWNVTYGGADEDWGYSVKQTTDGGYVVAGFTRSFGAGSMDAWLVKTDSVGNVAWRRTYGTESTEQAISVRQTTDGGYIVAGWKSPPENLISDAWLIKTDADGNELWEKTFGGSGSEEALSVIQASDGGYVITGSITSSGAGGQDVWLFKTD